MTFSNTLVMDTNRKQQLRNDSDYIHIMKYMGSKRELLPEIKSVISTMIPERQGVLDLFAGTGNVGIYLKNKYNIISNDIQKYSKIITNALIGSSTFETLPHFEQLTHLIKNQYVMHMLHLQNILKSTLSKSDDYLLIGKGNWTEKARLSYTNFVKSFPSPVNGFKTDNSEFKTLFNIYVERNQTKANDFPYIMMTFLFSETYFSVRQAIEIDSILYAINSTQIPIVIKDILKTALIYAVSYSSSGTGHFAMFRDMVDIKSAEDSFLYRTKNVWDLFEKKLKELYDFHNFVPDLQFQSFSSDYSDLLKQKELSKNYDLIYADPPYSFVHYSRFYHLIESLIRYDYDIPKFKGRYRTDRHQSPFCQKQNVNGAFEVLFKLAKANNSHILLSYSDTGMINIEEILNIANTNSFKSEVIEIEYNHSTMGRKGHKSNKITEYLIKSTI